MTWSRSWYTFHPPWNLQIFSPNLHIVLYSYQQYINVPICPHPHQHVIFTSFSSVQFSLVTQSCPTLCDPWTCARQASLSITNSQSLPKLMSIESVMPSNHLILCHPLLLLASIFPSELLLHIRWPKYWSFTFSISPSNEYSGLFSFRMDWLDLLAVQGTLKSLLQHHSSKASILRHSAFFIA